jgi:hypothetical protein
MKGKSKYLDLGKECKGFKKNNKLFKETLLEGVQVKIMDSSRVFNNNFIFTKQEEESLEVYIIYDPIVEITVKSLFFHLDKIMDKLQKNETLLVSKIYIREELEQLATLFDHVEILIAELQVPPHARIGLFFMAQDAEILSKFENLVNQIYSASNQQ